jgi:hypothetical protein
MNRRIVAGFLAGLTLVLAGAAVLFALGAAPQTRANVSGRPHSIPHPLTGEHAQCRDCHDGSPPLATPATHRKFTDKTGTSCHRALEPPPRGGPRLHDEVFVLIKSVVSKPSKLQAEAAR